MERSRFYRQLKQLIPPWGVRYVHYYGLYSSRCKARWQHWPHAARVAPTRWKDSHPEQLPADILHTNAQTIYRSGPVAQHGRS